MESKINWISFGWSVYYFLSGSFFVLYTFTNHLEGIVAKGNKFLIETGIPASQIIAYTLAIVISGFVFYVLYRMEIIQDTWLGLITIILASWLLANFLLFPLVYAFFSFPASLITGSALEPIKVSYSMSFIVTCFVFIGPFIDFIKLFTKKEDQITIAIVIAVFIMLILLIIGLIKDDKGVLLNGISTSFTYFTMGVLLITKSNNIDILKNRNEAGSHT